MNFVPFVEFTIMLNEETYVILSKWTCEQIVYSKKNVRVFSLGSKPIEMDRYQQNGRINTTGVTCQQ